MSAIIYTNSRDFGINEPKLSLSESVVDANCALKAACVNAPIGYNTDDGHWYSLVVIRVNDPQADPVLACEDCAEWLSEALHNGVEYSQ